MTKPYICHKFESVTFVTLKNVTKCHKKTCDWYKLGYVLRFGFGLERLSVDFIEAQCGVPSRENPYEIVIYLYVCVSDL